jgi:hypothetical protein
MTLAEIFLLILFVVWYSQGAGAGPEWERIARDRQLKIDTLNSQIEAQNHKIEELEKIRDWWRKNFGVNPPASMEELVALQPKGLIIKANGGSNLTPKCSELGLKEVLFSTVIRGSDLYELNGIDKSFEEVLAAYAPALCESREKKCRYVINAYPGVKTTDDFVLAFRRLRSAFYVQLP